MIRSPHRRTTIVALLVSAAVASTAAAERVSVRPLADVVVAIEQSAPAEVVAANRTTIAAEVAGKIVAIGADVGAEVERGELLVEIDRRDYQLALRRAQAALASRSAEIERARTQLERARRLAERQYASPDEILTLETTLAVLERAADTDRVNVDAARLDLARTRVLAPFDGVVERRGAALGGYVAPGTALMTLTELGGRELDVALNPVLLESLRAAESPRFTANGGDYPVAIERVAAVLDPDTRQATVRLSFPESAPPIGALGTLAWTDADGRIPVALIERRDGSLGVFVLSDAGTARFHRLPGAAEGRPARHDLDDDTRIVVDGRVRINDGDTVTLTER